MMFNGLKRRMNEIILFFEKRTEEEGNEERDDEWIYNIAGFGKSSSIEEYNSKSKDGAGQKYNSIAE